MSWDWTQNFLCLSVCIHLIQWLLAESVRKKAACFYLTMVDTFPGILFWLWEISPEREIPWTAYERTELKAEVWVCPQTALVVMALFPWTVEPHLWCLVCIFLCSVFHFHYLRPSRKSVISFRLVQYFWREIKEQVSKRGLPGSSAVKNPPAMQEALVQFLGLEDLLGKG